MKCTNCGENNACYHYKYNINGKITEAHLCADCAAKMEGNGELAKLNDAFKDFDQMFSGFDSMFDSLMNRPLFGSFGSFPSFSMPVLTFPHLAAPETTEREASQAAPKTSGTGAKESTLDPELSKKREINALREEMRAAAESEDYEKAAKLRDQIKELEKQL